MLDLMDLVMDLVLEIMIAGHWPSLCYLVGLAVKGCHCQCRLMGCPGTCY